MKGDEAKAMVAGCDGYLTKPIDPEAFPQALAAFLAAPRIAANANAEGSS
jgi:CheY-like chemotaxis protein